MSGPTGDVVWVDVLPSLDKFAPLMRTGLGAATGVATASGATAGKAFGVSFGDSAALALDAAASKVGAANKRMADATGNLNVQLAKLSALMNDDKVSADRLAAANEAVAKAQRNVQLQTDLAATALKQQAVVTKAVADETVVATEKTSLLTKRTEEHNSASKILTGTMGLASKALTVGFGAALAALPFLAAIRDAQSFDRQMTLVQTQAGASAQEIRNLTPAVLGLAGKTAQAPEELALSLYHVESTGIRGAKAIDVVSAAAKFATVSHANLEETTNALTSSVASGIPGFKNMNEAIGILNATVGSGDMKLSDLNEALGSGLLTIVKTYGLTMRDVAAALATFGDNNIRGALAATDLRLAVQALAVPSKQGRGELEKLGLSADTLAKDMQTGGLNKAIIDLKAHLDRAGISTEQTGQILTEVFGKKAGPGLAILVSQFDRLQSKYVEVNRQADDFGAAWDTTTKTAAFAFQALLDSLKAFAIVIGNAVLPFLTSVALKVSGFFSDWVAGVGVAGKIQKAFGDLWAFLSSFIDSIKPALSAMWNGLKDALGLVIDGFSALAGWIKDNKQLVEGFLVPILVAVATFKTFNLAVMGLVGVFKLAIGAWELLSAAFAFSPIGFVIALVAGLVVGFIYLWNTCKPFRDFWLGLWSDIKSIVGASIDGVEQAWRTFIGALVSAWNTVSGALTSAWNTFWGGLSGAYHTTVDAITGAWKATTGAFKTAWDAVAGALTSAWNTFWFGLGFALGTVAKVLTDAWNTVTGFLESRWNSAWTYISGTASAVWGAISGFFTGAFNAFVGFFRGIWDGLADYFTRLWDVRFRQPVENIWGVISVFFEKTWAAITKVFQDNWNAIASFFTTIWNAISSFAQTIWNAIADFFKGAWATFTTLWNIFWTVVSKVFTDAWNAISSAARNAWNAIASFFTNAWAVLTQEWNIFWGAVSKIFTDAWNAVSAFAQNIWNSIARYFVDQWSQLTREWDIFWGAVSKIFTDSWNAISSFAQNIWNSIANFFKGAWATLTTLWNIFWTVISDFFTSKWNGISSTGRSIWGDIAGFFTGAWRDFTNGWNGFWDGVGRKFSDIWNGIRDFARLVWEDIKRVVATPINFVIDTILNKGLFAAWNTVNDFLLLPWHIQDLHTIGGFSGGGYTGDKGLFGTGAREDPVGVVHAGEFVHTQEKTKQWMPLFQLIHQGLLQPSDLNMPGFAGGGLASTPQSQWTWPELDHIRQAMFPGSVLTDAYRPGANDYHGAGQAIDIGWAGNDYAHLFSIAAALAKAYPNSTELIHDPNGSIKNGQVVAPGFWGIDTWLAHQNHVHWAMTQQALGAGNPNPGGVNLLTVAGHVISSITDALGSLTGSITGPIGSLFSTLGKSKWVQILAALPTKLLGGLWGKVSGAVGGALSALLSSSVPNAAFNDAPAAPAGNAGSIQAQVQQQMVPFGWGSGPEWDALVKVITRESGWNPGAQNPTSSASGLGQFITSTWDAYRPGSANGYPFMKNAPVNMQASAIANYIGSVYRDPIGAWNSELRRGFYDAGGLWPSGTLGWNFTGADERVLTPQQDNYFRDFVDATGANGGTTGDRALISGGVHLTMADSNPHEVLDELVYRMRVASRGGVFSTVYGR